MFYMFYMFSACFYSLYSDTYTIKGGRIEGERWTDFISVLHVDIFFCKSTIKP